MTKSGVGQETFGCGSDAVCVPDTRGHCSPLRTLLTEQTFCFSFPLQTFSLCSQIYAEGLIHLDSARTLQGSPLSFSCGGMDDIVSTTDYKPQKKRRRGTSVDSVVASLNREKSL